MAISGASRGSFDQPTDPGPWPSTEDPPMDATRRDRPDGREPDEVPDVYQCCQRPIRYYGALNLVCSDCAPPDLLTRLVDAAQNVVDQCPHARECECATCEAVRALDAILGDVP
jgi:hypothetical protein